ncbi:4a-hydroxytetrahydrobiopterin dehydratase [Rosistilla ulvae]|uniref:Putative pterin-4-alpha-carbinolamine dehydratase n=1 Tax=Rosistilla ulvae TaxID=1930277 RepID=A0A517M702_9BACT|nr:4a-hydroxytetrahydrobiopterin dehydratase [Rosistilla ulvae]QDS90653.1 Putative pterin-4-alpha-carbinolamine dehydratase [Rosistilla ulvae]
MDISSMDQLAKKKCKPCEGGVDPCSAAEAQKQLQNLPGWQLSDDEKWIRKQWNVKHFVQGMEFLNRVAEVAEQDGHHPDVHLIGYRKVNIELSTHAIGGLSENDFILAAKIDQVAP